MKDAGEGTSVVAPFRREVDLRARRTRVCTSSDICCSGAGRNDERALILGALRPGWRAGAAVRSSLWRFPTGDGA